MNKFQKENLQKCLDLVETIQEELYEEIRLSRSNNISPDQLCKKIDIFIDICDNLKNLISD